MNKNLPVSAAKCGRFAPGPHPTTQWMRRYAAHAAGLVLGLLSSWSHSARAANTIDFEDLARGTIVTNQYPGVTFSTAILGTPCNPTFMKISAPDSGNTSSGTNCLKITLDCGGISDDYLVMVFDIPQTHVSFTLGDLTTTWTVRSYTSPGGGAVYSTQSIISGPGVQTLVTVPGSGIRRIEVESNPRGSVETIDDLTFDLDTTPPIAEIASPGFEACVCDNFVQVRGRACDDPVTYGRDTLEYLPVGGGAWTPVGSYTSPSCVANSLLYLWDTTLVPDGAYYLRLTVTNKSGLSSNAITTVVLHRSIDATAIRLPTADTLLGGTVCIDGSANDRCFSYYTVQYKPLSGGSFTPVDPMHSTYTTPIGNDPLAHWNTATNTIPDGKYLLRVITYDLCGLSATNAVTVSVDNTPPMGALTAPVQCSKRYGIVPIYGTAADANLASWALYFSDAVTHTWHNPPIATGTSPVVNGLLAYWDTTGLPACAYSLLLVVSDQSHVGQDCDGNYGVNQAQYMVSLDLVSDPLAQDTDGDGMPDAWEMTYGFNPNDPSDAAQDADNDGKTNLEEYLAGTDPRNPLSVFRLTSLVRDGADAQVTWTTQDRGHYVLERSAQAAGGAFSAVSPVISIPPNGSHSFTYTHTNGAAAQQGFYRVHLLH